MSSDPFDQYGPQYNIDGATLKKFRNQAREGLASLVYQHRQAYGAAVEAAVLSAQRNALRRAGPSLPSPNCASGTLHTTGEAIHKAIREQQRNALLACPSQIRRTRTPQQWFAIYEDAMAEKRNGKAAASSHTKGVAG